MSWGFSEEDGSDFGGVRMTARRRMVFDMRLRNPLRIEPTRFIQTGNEDVLGMRTESKRRLKPVLLDYQLFYTTFPASTKQPFHKILGKYLKRIDQDGPVTMDTEHYPTAPIQEAVDLLNLMRNVTGFPPDRDIPKPILSSPAIQRKYSLLHSVEDFVSFALSGTEGSADYLPKCGIVSATHVSWPLMAGIYVLSVGNCHVLVHENQHCILWSDELRLLFELTYSRFVLHLCTVIGHLYSPTTYPPWDVLRDFLVAGDSALIRRGNNAYSAFKLIESICIGYLLETDTKHGIFDTGEFLRLMKKECDREDPEFCRCLCRSLDEIKGSPHMVSQIFGLFRAFGHPYVDVKAGARKVRKVAQSFKELDRDLIAEITSAGIEEFCVNYREKNGRWNPMKAPRGDREVYRAIRDGRPLNKFSSKYKIEDWLEVEILPLFNPAEFLEETDLIEDKACSANLDEIYNSLRTSSDLPKSLERKTLLKFLAIENVDVIEELRLINENGISQEDLVIGVTPKERELKREPRLFSLMTFKFRLYITATEKLLSECIVPYFPDVTMTYSLSDLKNKMYGIGSQMSSDVEDTFHFVFNLDFEKWNLQFRHELTYGLFNFFDKLFGYSHLMSRTHELFGKCVFYIADRYCPLTPEDFDFPNDESTWRHHWGGMEGLRQKGWTLLTSAVLRVISTRLQLRLEVMGQGDNQVIVAHIPIPRRYKDGSIPKSAVSTVRETYVELKEQLSKVFSRLGLPIKKEETWSSGTLFAYGKILILNGMQLSMSLKRACRMFFQNNEFIPTFFNSMASIGTASEAMAEYDVTPNVAYVMQFLEIRRCCDYYLRYHPLTGRTIVTNEGRLSDETVKISPPELAATSAKILGDTVNLTHLLMCCNTTLGGYAIPSYYDLCVKGFPDRLSLAAAILFKIKETQHPVPSIVRQCVDSILTPKFAETTDFARLFEDPYALNLTKPTGSTELVRTVTRTFLQSPSVANKYVKELTSVESSMQKEISGILESMEPCLPRLCNLVLENSPVGLCQKALSKFEKPDTIQRVARRLALWSILDVETRIADSDSALFLYFIHCCSRCAKPLSLSEGLFLFCNNLRRQSWGRPVEGVTVPPPFWFLKTHFAEYQCYNSLGQQYVDVVGEQASERDLFEIHGRFQGYLGSSTKQKVSTHTPYAVESRTGPIQAAKRLASHKGWLYSQELDGFGLLVNKILSSLTDIPSVYFSCDIVPIESSTGHRLQDTAAHHHGFPGLVASSYSHFLVSTDTLGEYSKGKQNHPIHFQQVICYAQHSALELIRAGNYNSAYSSRAKNPRIHLHIVNTRDLPGLDDYSVNLECPQKTDSIIPHPDVRAAYTPMSAVTISLRLQSKTATSSIDPEKIDEYSRNNCFSRICGQEILRAIIRRCERARTSSMARDELPKIWYFRADIPTVVRTVCSGMIGYSLCHLRRNQYIGHSGADVALIVDYIIRFWSVTESSCFSCLEKCFSIPECRTSLIINGFPVVFARSVPPTLSAVLDSVKASMLRIVLNTLLKNEKSDMKPFVLETTGDSLGITPIICNINWIWLQEVQHGKMLVSSTDRLSVVHSALRIGSQQMQDLELPSATLKLSEYVLAQLTHLAGVDVVKEWKAIIMEAMTITHYMTSLEAIRKQTGEVPNKNDYRRRAEGAINKSLAIFEMRLDLMRKGDHVHSIECALPSQVLPNRHLLRPLRLETGAVYKWFSLLSNLMENPYRHCAGLGDGSGGVCALMGTLWPECSIYYNTLFDPEGKDIYDFGEFYPQALEHAGVSPDRVHGLDVIRSGFSDLTDRNWPPEFAKCLRGELDLITCDAEGSGWGESDKGMHMINNILRLASLKGKKAVIVFKHYLANIDHLNNGLKAFQEWGGHARIMCSTYTSKNSSEVFIQARPHDTWSRGRLLHEWRGISCVSAKTAVRLHSKITSKDVANFQADNESLTSIYHLSDELTFLQFSLADIGIPVHLLGAQPNIHGILKHLLLLPHRTLGIRYLDRVRNPRDVTFTFGRLGDSVVGLLTLLFGFLLHGTTGINKDYSKLGIISVCILNTGKRWIMIPFADDSLKKDLFEFTLTARQTGVYLWSLPVRFFEERESRELFRKVHFISPLRVPWYDRIDGITSEVGNLANVILTTSTKMPATGIPSALWKTERSQNPSVTLVKIIWPAQNTLLYPRLMSAFEKFLKNIENLSD